MPHWLSDPSRTFLILLGALSVAAGVAAILLFPDTDSVARTGKTPSSRARRLLLSLALVMGIAVICLLITDFLWESDREQITRKIEEMSAGVAERNLDKVFQHVSERFQYGVATKAALRARGESALQSGQVTAIPIWDIQVPPIPHGAERVKVLFRFKVKGNVFTENQFIGEGVFANEDGQWRLIGIEVYSPTGTRDRYAIPGL
jgi:hypothetical protein